MVPTLRLKVECVAEYEHGEWYRHSCFRTGSTIPTVPVSQPTLLSPICSGLTVISPPLQLYFVDKLMVLTFFSKGKKLYPL